MHAGQNGIYSGYMIQANFPNQFGMEAPRPTGNARTASIIGMFCLILYGYGIAKHRIFYLIASFCFAAVLFYQGRGAWVALLITAIIILQLIPKDDRPNFGNIVRFITISAGMLLSIWLTIYGIANIAGNSNDVELFRNFMQKDNVTSGRLFLWENGFNAFLSSPLFGLGGQSDRVHLNHNVSNMLIYILMCRGVIGLIFSTLPIVKPLTFIWTLSRNKTDNKNNVTTGITFCTIAIFIFLSVRGLVENSYSLFNIDFLLVVPTIWYLSLQHDKKQKNRL